MKQRSKLHWLDIVDQNNKTFHRAVKSRQARNLIREISCPHGNVVNTHQEVKAEAERFFFEFLNRCPEKYQGISEEELQELCTFRFTPEDRCLLDAEVTSEEIRKVLFAMRNNKSPGPDGFPDEFFKTTWSILGSDFTIAVQSVFKFGFLPK